MSGMTRRHFVGQSSMGAGLAGLQVTPATRGAAAEGRTVAKVQSHKGVPTLFINDSPVQSPDSSVYGHHRRHSCVNCRLGSGIAE
jgi:hypothetical protein